jgi:hypothetical protein
MMHKFSRLLSVCRSQGTGSARPTTVGDYIEITAMKRTFVRVCPGATPRPLRLYATQRMA